MSTALTHEAALPGILREDGYDLPAGLPYERWRSIGVALQQMQRSVNWWVGDWLRYGEEHYGDAVYQAVKEITGHGDTAIRNAVWVAEKFPPATRVAELSWSHHRAVAELDAEDRSALLREASAEKLPVADLIDRVHERKRVIRAASMVGGSEASPSLAWRPTKADLTDEARTALESRLSEMGRRHAVGFEAGFIQGLIWAHQTDAFKDWRA